MIANLFADYAGRDFKAPGLRSYKKSEWSAPQNLIHVL
jgi:hypothetical protein